MAAGSSLETWDEPTELRWQDFEATLASRRGEVYDYLDGWPNASDFQPHDIHEAIYSYLRRRGKALRPLLLLLACEAVGGDPERAIPAAAAVEVFHTWTLVHDDIIDRDETRRGSPTVHARYKRHVEDEHGLEASVAAHYGTTVAILTGDLQQSWVYALLVELAERGVPATVVLGLIKRMSVWLTPQLMEGEMLDVQFSLMEMHQLTESHILSMLTKKTAALLDYAGWCGAQIGLGGALDSGNYADSLGRFGSYCGTAFQLRDDLLGLTADEAHLGKPVGSDLREGKRTLIVHHALTVLGATERRKLEHVLGNQTAATHEVTGALTLLRECGSFEYVTQLANTFIEQAMNCLIVLPDTRAKALLRLWATYMLTRTN